MGRSVHGEDDGGNGRREGSPWLRAIGGRASAAAFKSRSGSRSDVARISSQTAMPGRPRVLGAPGRAGAAHVVQFRPVGVERPVEELAPEGAELGEGLCRSAAACAPGRYAGKGCRSDRCHDAACCFRSRPGAAWSAFFGAENEFWPDLLKDGFNCPGSGAAHMVSIPYSSVVNGWKTGPAVALWGPRRYISGSKFP